MPTYIIQNFMAKRKNGTDLKIADDQLFWNFTENQHQQ